MMEIFFQFEWKVQWDFGFLSNLNCGYNHLSITCSGNICIYPILYLHIYEYFLHVIQFICIFIGIR